MRVPDGLMAITIGTQLSRVSQKMARLQTEVASGIRIQRPSDDPGGALRAANLRNGLAQVEHYQGAVTDSQVWLKSEDKALADLQDMLRQVRTAGLQGANPMNEQARETLARQIEQLSVTVVQSGNSTDGYRFLFGGFNTRTTAFTDVAGTITYQGDANIRQVTIGDGVSLTLNHTGAQVFNMAGDADASLPDLFASVLGLADAVRGGNQTDIQTRITELEQHQTRIGSIRAETGTRLQQVQLTASRLDQNKLVLTDLLAETEGSDLSETLVKLKEQENIFQAATYVASRVTQSGLLSWLR